MKNFNLKNKILNFIDLETTGFSHRYHRIIEIGILKVKDNKVIDKYDTLVNPRSYISSKITEITGIKKSLVKDSPQFEEVSKDLGNFIQDEIIVAHNAIFDFSFLRSEFNRLDRDFKNPYACTRRLSSILFPQYRSHNLDSIIRRFNIEISSRHRALDDTKAMFDFFRKANELVDKETFIESFRKSISRPG